MVKQFKILRNDVTEEGCSDLIGKVFQGRVDGEMIAIKVPEEWYKSNGFRDSSNEIFLLENEVEEVHSLKI